MFIIKLKVCCPCNYGSEYAGKALGRVRNMVDFFRDITKQMTVSLDHSINTEKLCPSVVQYYPRAFGSRATLHNFGA